MKRVYLFLAIIGLILPYIFLVQFLSQNGLDLRLFYSQLFANPISIFLAVDLILTAIVFWVFSYHEVRKHDMKNWWLYVIATLIVGPSFSLPLFLYFHERQIERPRSSYDPT